MVFSGDLGNPDAVLMNDPERVEQADLVLMEGTYGNRDHRTLTNTMEELAAALQEAHLAKGNVLIPAFAVGRTQEMLFHLGVLHKQGKVPQQKIFLDSPMGIEVTRLYTQYMDLLDPEDLKQVSAKLAGIDEQAGLLRKTERLSNQHWKLVYLQQHPDWQGEAVIVAVDERKTVILIPELALETKIRTRENFVIDDTIRVRLTGVELPEQEVFFSLVK